MPEGGGHFGLALAGAETEAQEQPGSPRRRMAGAAAVSLVLHGVVVAALLLGLAHQNRNVDAGETPATVELVMSPPGSRETNAPLTETTRERPNKPTAVPAPPAPPTRPPTEAKPTAAKPPPAPPKTTPHPPPAAPKTPLHPPAAKAPAAPPPPTPPATQAEPALPLPPATVPAPATPSAAKETPPAKAMVPSPPSPAPAPPSPDAAESPKADAVPAPAPKSAASAVASAPQPAPRPAAESDAAPARESKLSFNLGGAASDTNALVTGDMLMPPTADPKFRNRKPSYPPEAAKRGEEGAVVLMIHVSPDGLVSGVDIAESSGFGLLDQAAREAALSWHFLPAVRNGHPVPFDMPLRIKFSLY